MWIWNLLIYPVNIGKIYVYLLSLVITTSLLESSGVTSETSQAWRANRTNGRTGVVRKKIRGSNVTKENFVFKTAKPRWLGRFSFCSSTTMDFFFYFIKYYVFSFGKRNASFSDGYPTVFNSFLGSAIMKPSYNVFKTFLWYENQLKIIIQTVF